MRNIYNALYGIQSDNSIDPKKALLPVPQQNLPTFHPDGSVTQAQQTAYTLSAAGSPPAPTTPLPGTGAPLAAFALSPERRVLA